MKKIFAIFIILLVFPTIAVTEQLDLVPVGLGQDKLHQTFGRESAIEEYNPDDIGRISRFSISVNNRDDLSVEGFLETSLSATRPDSIVIPFLQEYPIQNIEVKFRIFNHKF